MPKARVAMCSILLAVAATWGCGGTSGVEKDRIRVSSEIDVVVFELNGGATTSFGAALCAVKRGEKADPDDAFFRIYRDRWESIHVVVTSDQSVTVRMPREAAQNVMQKSNTAGVGLFRESLSVRYEEF